MTKDNPVPSIDEYLKTFINKNIIVVSKEKGTALLKDFVRGFKKSQNGVETDNEQPNECKCSGDTSCMCT